MLGGLSGALHLSTSSHPSQRGPDQVRLELVTFIGKLGWNMFFL